MPNTGNTTTFTHSVWGNYTPEIISISPPAYSLESIDNTDLTTTGFKKMLPADLQEIGEMSIVVQVPEDAAGRFANEVGDLLQSGTMFDDAVGTLTISFPAGTSGDGVLPKLAGTGYVTGYEPAEVNNDDRMTATITLQFDGATQPTYTVGAAS